MHRMCLALALLGTIGCAETKAPDPTPAQDGGPYDMIDPVPAPIAEETAPAAGEWTRSGSNGVRFGAAGAAPLFSIGCDERGGIRLVSHDADATGAAELMTISLGTATHRLAATWTQEQPRTATATVPDNHALMAELAELGGPIRVELGDSPLLLPPSPLIRETVLACATTDTNRGP